MSLMISTMAIAKKIKNIYSVGRPANVKWPSGVSPGHSRNHDAKHWQQAHRNEAGMLWSYLRPGRVTKSILINPILFTLIFPKQNVKCLSLHLKKFQYPSGSGQSPNIFEFACKKIFWFDWRANQWPSIVENNVLFYSCQQLNLSRAQTFNGIFDLTRCWSRALTMPCTLLPES